MKVCEPELSCSGANKLIKLTKIYFILKDKEPEKAQKLLLKFLGKK